MGDAVLREFRLATRRLLKTPGFSFAAVTTLAVALAVLTTVAALVDVAFLRPLPYADADRLVSVTSTMRGEEISVSWPDYEDWRRGTSAFESLDAYRRNNLTLTGGSGPAERLRGLEVTSGLFQSLGVQPALGRALGPGADLPGAEATVVLGHDLWVSRFGGDPDVLGRSLTLDGEPWTVVGVMPEGFRFPDGIILAASDLFLPVGPAVEGIRDRQQHAGTYVLNRLSPGRSLDDARGELSAVATDLARRYPETNAEEGVHVIPALDRVVGDARPALLLMSLAGVLVLLVACANVSGLFLARTAARRREFVVRTALGAGRGRITLQLVAEAGMLALVGGSLGVLAGGFALEAARPWLSALPRVDEAAVDLRVALIALAAASLSGILVSVLPVLGLRQARFRSALGSRNGAQGSDGTFGRSVLVGAQVAVAAVLLVAAGLLGRGFQNLAAEDGGIRPEGVIVFRVSLPADRYESPSFGNQPQAEPSTLPGGHAAFTELERRLLSLPGVTDVGGISTLPFSGSGSQAGIAPAGWEAEGDEAPPRVDVAVVRPGYFGAMGVELLRGRTFTEADDEGSPPTVVVDERLAERFWPGQDPLGQNVTGWGFREATVVGVVEHVKNYGVGRDSRAEMYVAHPQRPWLNMYVVVRTERDPALLTSAVRDVMTEFEPNAPVTNLSTMTAVVDRTIAEPRLAAILGGALACVAALLAVLGLYALLAYMVAGRTREIGVRMALGAPSRSVQRMVVVQGLRLAAVGGIVGLAGAAVLAPALEPVVLGAEVGGSGLYLAVGASLLLVATAAAWIPAGRAASVNPSEALGE